MPPFDLILYAFLLVFQTPSSGPNTQAASPSNPAPKPSALTANPNPTLPGQVVTLRWPETTEPVTLSGGGFGSRKVIKGQNWANDRPAKRTTYALTAGVREGRAKKADASPAKSAVTVDVYSGTFPRLATYTDTRGWSIDVIAGWNRYVVDLEDKGNNALIFFQPVEDSTERVAVSQLPVAGMTAAELMHKVETDIPTQYDMLTVLERKETSHAGLPAAWMVFTGTEISHPETPTKSMVLAFVQGSRGYVISARTTTGRFADSEKLLRCLVRSFNPIEKMRVRPAAASAPKPK